MKKKSKIEIEAKKHRDKILEGCFISVDPSSGSEASQPALSVWRNGRCIYISILNITPNRKVHLRLQDLAKEIRNVCAKYVPDLLVIESFPMHMGYASRGVLHLQYSVGCILGAAPTSYILEVTPGSWHARVPKDYEKSDLNDCLAMGYTALYWAAKSANLGMEKFDAHKILAGESPVHIPSATSPSDECRENKVRLPRRSTSKSSRSGVASRKKSHRRA